VIKHVVRVLVATAVLAGAWAVAPTASASVDDCIDHAVAFDASEHVAFYACQEESLTGCYRVFRDNYGRQQWALDACKQRND
jgi:hypothetical protein